MQRASTLVARRFIVTMAPKIPDIGKVRQLIPPLSGDLHKGQAGMSECCHLARLTLYFVSFKAAWVLWVALKSTFYQRIEVTHANRSLSYTGAPFFSGVASMKLVGVDCCT